MMITLNGTHTQEIGVRKNIYKTALLSLFDKKKIWSDLNEQRLLRQKEHEMKQNLLFNKKIYAIDNKKYYKIIGLNTSYYIQVESFNTQPSSQYMIQLGTYGFNGMKSKRGLIKIDKVRKKIAISEDTLRVYFKPYEIEDIHDT